MGPTISRAALEVLDRIFDRARHTRREVSEATVVEAVRGLEALREPGVIRYLARLLQRPGGSPSPTDSALARALSTLAFVAQPAHLPRLDVEFRRSRGLSVGEELEALASKSDPAFLSGLLALASMDADGFVREHALRRLAESADSRVLPFLFLRLDDWVEPVRRVAMTAIHTRMKLSAARDFMRCLGILPHLDLKRRVRETKLIDWVREWLLQPELAGHLALGLTAPEHEVRMEAFQLCARSAAISRRWVAQSGLRDAYPPLRWAAVKLGRTLAGADGEAFLEEARTHRDRRVRGSALELWAVRKGPAAEGALREALLDPAELVRNIARFRLDKLSRRDFASIYVEALTALDPKTLAAALGGLEAVGEPEHAALVAPFLGHPSGRVGSAALLALARLDPSSTHVRLPELLMSDRPALIRTAVKLLRRSVSPTDIPALARVVAHAVTPGARANAAHLLGSCNKWFALPPLLSAFGDPDPRVREAARIGLERWLHAYRYSTHLPPRPTATEQVACEAALSTTSTELPPRIREGVEAALRKERS